MEVSLEAVVAWPSSEVSLAGEVDLVASQVSKDEAVVVEIRMDKIKIINRIQNGPQPSMRMSLIRVNFASIIILMVEELTIVQIL